MYLEIIKSQLHLQFTTNFYYHLIQTTNHTSCCSQWLTYDIIYSNYQTFQKHESLGNIVVFCKEDMATSEISHLSTLCYLFWITHIFYFSWWNISFIFHWWNVAQENSSKSSCCEDFFLQEDFLVPFSVDFIHQGDKKPKETGEVTCLEIWKKENISKGHNNFYRTLIVPNTVVGLD